MGPKLLIEARLSALLTPRLSLFLGMFRYSGQPIGFRGPRTLSLMKSCLARAQPPFLSKSRHHLPGRGEREPEITSEKHPSNLIPGEGGDLELSVLSNLQGQTRTQWRCSVLLHTVCDGTLSTLTAAHVCSESFDSCKISYRNHMKCIQT